MADEQCPLCEKRNLTTPAHRAMMACAICARQLGLIPLPPARRPPLPCVRCNQRQFVRVIPREYTINPDPQYDGQITAPMYLTYAPTASRGILRSQADKVDVRVNGVGLLEAYVCRKCGAVEWYCADAENIPAHPHLMSELVDCEGDNPYR
jgi:hypothetical protein